VRVVVVGAANIDLISYVPRLPVIGETLHGTSFRMGFGGKGANQAVMAAKLGAEVAMICKLGRDVFGEGTFENFRSMGVDVEHVTFTDEAFSGVAPIAVDPEGRNSIIIVTGANDLLSAADLERARAVIAAADVVVAQLELPVETSLAALRIACEEGVRTVFNPAPARERLPEELYELSDVICPNEPETELLTGMPAGPEAARELLSRGAGAVVLTLGERGCLVVENETAVEVPVEQVQAVDTTGAGDAFVGALAALLAAGRPLADAAERANAVAALSVQRHGTQTSFPTVAELAAGFARLSDRER
jgi:ribokinase